MRTGGMSASVKEGKSGTSPIITSVCIERVFQIQTKECTCSLRLCRPQQEMHARSLSHFTLQPHLSSGALNDALGNKQPQSISIGTDGLGITPAAEPMKNLRYILLRNAGGMRFRADTTTGLQTDSAYGYGLSFTDVNEDGQFRAPWDRQ